MLALSFISPLLVFFPYLSSPLTLINPVFSQARFHPSPTPLFYSVTPLPAATGTSGHGYVSNGLSRWMVAGSLSPLVLVLPTSIPLKVVLCFVVRLKNGVWNQREMFRAGFSRLPITQCFPFWPRLMESIGLYTVTVVYNCGTLLYKLYVAFFWDIGENFSQCKSARASFYVKAKPKSTWLSCIHNTTDLPYTHVILFFLCAQYVIYFP